MDPLTRHQMKELWKDLPFNYKTAIKLLQRDSVFCDYFNAFLSLPAFSRPLFYDRKKKSLLEVYADAKVHVVGLTVRAPHPTGDVQDLLQLWLLKYRLPLFLRTTLYTEYCLCKQLLRVCGAVPDREASEEELTESEEEEESVLEEDKERPVLDIAGFNRNSQMSQVEGLTTPLVTVPESAPPSAPTTPLPSGILADVIQESEERSETAVTDPDRDLITLSSASLLEGVEDEDIAESDYEDSLPSQSALPEGKSVRLPEIGSATNITTQNYAEPVTEMQSPTDVGTSTASPHLTEGDRKVVPEVLSQSITDMLPDSQSDIASPHVWQRLYKDRHPTSNTMPAACSPSPVMTGDFNEDFPEININQKDKKALLGSVSGMDSLREFLSRTAGEHLLNLWLDVAQVEKQLLYEEDAEMRVSLIRDLQDKYRTRLTRSAKDRLIRREHAALAIMKSQALHKLQFYWVPRFFQMKITSHIENGIPLKLELDEELLRLPFLPSAAVSRSYPSHLTNLTTVINDTEMWQDMFNERDSRIISGRLRHMTASIVGSKKDHFMYGLRADKNAGGPFRQWLEGNGNTELLNLLLFCEEVTRYRVYEERKADRGILKRAGWRIWHTYMAPGAPYSVGLGPAVTNDIRLELLSTNDYVHYTTFDIAKGNLMMFLKRAWKEYIQIDYEHYLNARPDIMEQIERQAEQRIRHMQGQRINQHRKRYKAQRRLKGRKKKLHTVFDSASEGELEDEDFENMSIPSLQDSVNNRQALEKFDTWARNLTGERLSNYQLWKDLRSFFMINKQSNKQLRTMQAEHIHRTHLLQKEKRVFQFPTEIQSKISRDQNNRPPSPLLTKTLTFVQGTTEKYFDEFVQSLPLAQAALRRRSASDDLNSQLSQQSLGGLIGGRRRVRGNKNKKVPGRATPTKELYHRLLNLLMSVTAGPGCHDTPLNTQHCGLCGISTGTWPEELLLFERYIGDHGADDGYPLIVNDLHFWVEVQRFKDMHHGDTSPDTILRKLEAIVDCYLDPKIPTEPPPEKPLNLSPPMSPSPSMASKGHSSAPESPVQSKIDLTSQPEKVKKLPWAQRKQVDLTVDVGQKIANRVTTPGGHLDKDVGIYEEAQRMVLKELVPFYAGFANAREAKDAALNTLPHVNQRWVGSPASDTISQFPLPSASASKRNNNTKEHFTFTLETGVTWTKCIDEDMISAISDDILLPQRPDPKGPKPKKETYSTEELLGSTNTGWFVAPQYLGSREAFPVVAIPKRKPRRPSVVNNTCPVVKPAGSSRFSVSSGSNEDLLDSKKKKKTSSKTKITAGTAKIATINILTKKDRGFGGKAMKLGLGQAADVCPV